MRRLRIFLQRLRRRCLSLIHLKSSKSPRPAPNRTSATMEKFSRRSCVRSCAPPPLLACNPCPGSTEMVVENFKYQIQRPGPKPKRSSSDQQLWRKEKSWRIVTRDGDKFVTKNVVLKKQMKRADEDLEKYRLSTSSSSNCGENQGLMCSWDRDLSFASGRSSFDLFDRLEASSKDSFSQQLSPIHRASISKHFPSPEHNCEELKAEEESKLYSSAGIRGVAVVKDSSDPYSDYRESMLQMSFANGLQDASEFQELLRCYLRLNSPEFHATILKAFTDLLVERMLL